MKATVGFFKGFAWGAASLLGILMILVVVLQPQHLPLASESSEPWIQSFAEWVYSNLRFSLIPFAGILTLYMAKLHQLRRQLQQGAPVEGIMAMEHWLDLLTGLFFGVGVIWTAIGMRSALLTALGNLDAQTAQTLGAFVILQRLVDGGILLALSTTIVGGIGGYLMKVLKSLVVGSALKQTYLHHHQAQQDEVVRLLRQMVHQSTDQTILAKEMDYVTADATLS